MTSSMWLRYSPCLQAHYHHHAQGGRRVLGRSAKFKSLCSPPSRPNVLDSSFWKERAASDPIFGDNDV